MITVSKITTARKYNNPYSFELLYKFTVLETEQTKVNPQVHAFVEEFIKGKIGLRVKLENDHILIYGNSLTIIIDIYKWIKLKLWRK